MIHDKSWGYNGYNQLSNIPEDKGYVAIACGLSHSVALKMMVLLGVGVIIQIIN